MPIITAERSGPCRACGGIIRKGEYCEYSSAEGASHPEPQCATAPARYRPNRRAGRCSCGAAVAAGKGRLRLVSDGSAQDKKSWAVDCARCADL